MDGHEIELLAPAGNRESLEKVVAAGADAVYLGGKSFNMRLLRPDLNFSDRELADACHYLHSMNKRIYVTVNNLYFDNEMPELASYLEFLNEIMVDAIIVQDVSVVKLHQDLGLTIPVHASVQMGISSIEAVRFLESQGFSRVILSKNLSLDEINAINKASNIGIEFFAHGDLCISYTGQCYLSSFLAGKSSNRGCCIKPCRFRYSLNREPLADAKYYLASNDLCLYRHLSDLVEAGVASFKIEGRMRSGDYIANIIRIYRAALDRVLQDKPVDSSGLVELQNIRIRDFTIGNLLGSRTQDSIGITGEREPFFPSFSSQLQILEPKDYIEYSQLEGTIEKIEVKIGNLESLERVISSGVDEIILGLDQIRQYKSGWKKDSIQRVFKATTGSKIKVLIETPRIVEPNDMIELKNLMGSLKYGESFGGFIVNDYGSFYQARTMGFPVHGGCGLNITNTEAVEYLKEKGMSSIMASLELNWENLKLMLQSQLYDLTILVQGPLCGMITDHCIVGSLDSCDAPCLDGGYSLTDEGMHKFPVYTDDVCRNYIYYPHHLCLFPWLPLLSRQGVRSIRIDGQFYQSNILGQVVDLYKEGVKALNQRQWKQKENYLKLLQMFPEGLARLPLMPN